MDRTRQNGLTFHVFDNEKDKDASGNPLAFVPDVAVPLLRCKKDIDPDFFYTMVFENRTGCSLNVTMSHYPHLNSDEVILFSLDIVAGASASGKIMEHALNELSTCTIRFDDGKKLEYHRERSGEVTDSSNPLNPLAYEFKKIDDMEGSLTFSIINAHYLQAE